MKKCKKTVHRTCISKGVKYKSFLTIRLKVIIIYCNKVIRKDSVLAIEKGGTSQNIFG